jgi:O-antigen ligase
MGYLLGVLGARGALVATFVYLATVLAFRVVARRAAIYWALAIVGGVLLSVVLGQADLLLRQAEKTLTGTNITSHRWELWTGSVSVWLESWRSFLFGFGPDAFHTYVRSQIGYPPNVHPHNAFVQAVIEFGLLGLVAFLGLLTLIARRALAVLTSAAASLEARLCAAGLAGFGAYMLVDGILFHALPLSFVAILTAFVFSAPQRGLPRAAGA